MNKVMIIEGMSCNHCKMRVENTLKELEGVTDVQVDLEKKSAELVLSEDVADAVLTEAVEDAGYDVVEIKA